MDLSVKGEIVSMSTVSIADQLKILIELQGLDGQIYQLKRELGLKPAEIARVKAEHQQFADGLKKLEDQHKSLEVKRNQMEIELGEKENQIKKLQGQLFQVKTNKEYSTLQKEIEGFKADKSVLEEEVLKFMEQIDQVKGGVTAERKELQSRESELKARLAKLDEETQRIQSSIQQLQSSRSALVPKLEPPILTRYERILVNKEGLALVPVKGEACSGCHMVLPPQMINEIHLATRLIPCESCARILYLESSE